ncbi:Cof-type HAD-IIB family hydrolase [Fonticella tunisiensis]|uniref:Sugar-phosphatase n=1 Tax=Fonticella tunisiensis TaxID=1096341 RepID=A0A4R7KMA7_9CLOT|nr:Cof-type HAD-IIB family hydrolase [Fonticella tunisiensis]TDT57234.1 hypothetical protein EDD71_11214 [Fonticella tunisiensis]
MYKLIALDMDRTLLRDDKSLSEKTIHAVRKARERGIRVVIASGRPTKGIRNYLEALGLVSEEDYVISYNGALVQNVKTGEIISKNVLLGKDVHVIYELSKKLGLHIHAFSKEHGLITPRDNPYTQIESIVNGFPIKEMDFSKVSMDDEIIKMAIAEEEEILTNAIKCIPEELSQRYTMVRSMPRSLEILSPNSNKGRGVEALAKHLGIKREEVICVGDAENDMHMIEFAGLGVAMGNATDSLKRIADYVSKSNEEDGVAHVIEKFALK